MAEITRTILDLRSGQVMTVSEKSAAREIAFGAAVETVPEDASAVSAWRKAQSDKVIAGLREKYDGAIGRRPDALNELLDAMRDYEAFCAANDLPAFPAQEPIAVRYLLARAASGDIEQHHVSRRAFLIGKLHEETKHPPRHLGETAFNAWNRAISFAQARLKKTHRNIYEIPAMAPAKAFEMFPDGDVPRHWHEVAA